jgi:hypothetical protein
MARQDRQHPLDMIEESRLKLALLLDLVGRPDKARDLFLTGDAVEGLHALLREIATTLERLAGVWPSSR